MLLQPHVLPSSATVCICLVRIPDGARLQLLVAMRGGPIQTAAGGSDDRCVCVCTCVSQVTHNRPIGYMPLPVPMDDGSELRYDDDDEDTGQPLVFCRYVCVQLALFGSPCAYCVSCDRCRMWGTKIMPVKRVKDKEIRYMLGLHCCVR